MRRYVKYQEDAERLDEDHELQEGLFIEANIQAAASGAGC
jgi:hypothetical protein